MAFWAMWMFVAAALTLIVTSIGTFLIWRQVRLTREAVRDTADATAAMRHANDISERNAHQQLRPYVYFDRAEIVRDTDGRSFVEVRAKNFGQTPAIDCVFASSLRVLPYPIPTNVVINASGLDHVGRAMPPNGEYLLSARLEKESIRAVDVPGKCVVMSVALDYPVVTNQGMSRCHIVEDFIFHRSEIQRGRGRPMRDGDRSAT